MTLQAAPYAEARRLFNKYLTAVSEYLMLESQIDSEKRGEVSPLAQIEAAWNRKERAKQAAWQHRIEHKC